MALTRTENIAINGRGDLQALRAATEEIGDLLAVKLPAPFASSAALVVDRDAASTEHIRAAWKEFDADGREPESGSISVLVGPRTGAYDVEVFLTFDVQSLHVSGHAKGFKREFVQELTAEIMAILNRHLA